MTLALLPGPNQSHTIHVDVVLVGESPRIGFFDRNGMLLETEFRTFVTDAATDVTCTLKLELQVPGLQMFVQSKPYSPVSAWTPSAGNTLCSQVATIGPGSNANGIMSSFNVAVCEAWGDPNAFWVDPTWPLGQAGSGGPKSVGAPKSSVSYFYVNDLGSSTAPKRITLYANVAVSETGTPYAWLSNADGVCVGTTMVLCPPAGSSPTDLMYCELALEPGVIARGYSVSVSSVVNVFYQLSGGAEGSFEVVINGPTGSTTSFQYYGQTSAPGPIWTNT